MDQNIIPDRYRIGKTYISITTPQHSIQLIEEACRQGITAHICVSDFRSVCYASSHIDYREIMDTSYLNLPDGMPLIWMARLWGIRSVSHTKGPELFVNLLKSPSNGLKHFLLGDTDEILEQIRSEYVNKYQALISGTYSPPFIDVNEYDFQDIAKKINDSGSDIVWISMTAPKQDYFAAKIKPLLNKKILIGVGAAFRYSVGFYKLPHRYLQKTGLTGVFMRRNSLWKFKWYAKHIFVLFGYVLQVISRRIIGLKYYE